jgi:phage terminase large subunit-like protein
LERERLIQRLSPKAAMSLRYDWEYLWARENQLVPPGNWRTFLVLCGRGFGKTRLGAEWIRSRAFSGQFQRMALIGQTAADVRDVMIRGEAGLLTISPPWFRPVYEPSKRILTWPNGVQAHTYSGDEPDQLRGPAHDTAWCDEPAKWARLQETWDNMDMGLRSGPKPQIVATTTPRPVPLIKALLADPTCVVRQGSTFDNAANLAPAFLDRMRSRYAGTRMGLQELEGRLLEDREGALWRRAQIDEGRVSQVPPLRRVVVAVDPSVSDGENSAECGIVTAGIGTDGRGYVLDDSSLRGSPLEWSRAVVASYSKLKADRVIAEKNQGGALVEATLRTVAPHLPYKGVHASRNKQARAEPVSALYEQGKISHVGTFPLLEEQMVEWVPGEASPDRLDALTWAFTELFNLSEPAPNPLAGIVVCRAARGW